MSKVTGPAVLAGLEYGYQASSRLVNTLTYTLSGATKGQVTRTFESNRDLLTSVENKWDTGSGLVTISKYAYTNDALGRRSDVVYTGSAFTPNSGDHLDLWDYNDRNELVESDRHAGTDPGTPGAEDADLGRDYTYDPIGNRRDYTKGSAARLYYCANRLNQYDETGADDQCDPATETFTHDEDGNLTSDGRFDQFLTDGSDQNGSGKPRPPAS